MVAGTKRMSASAPGEAVATEILELEKAPTREGSAGRVRAKLTSAAKERRLAEVAAAAADVTEPQQQQPQSKQRVERRVWPLLGERQRS